MNKKYTIITFGSLIFIFGVSWGSYIISKNIKEANIRTIVKQKEEAQKEEVRQNQIKEAREKENHACDELIKLIPSPSHFSDNDTAALNACSGNFEKTRQTLLSICKSKLDALEIMSSGDSEDELKSIDRFVEMKRREFNSQGNSHYILITQVWARQKKQAIIQKDTESKLELQNWRNAVENIKKVTINN